MSRDVKMQGAGDSQGAGGHDGEADAPRAAPAQAPDHLKIDDWISEGEIEGGDFNTAGEVRRWGEQHPAHVIDHASFAELMEGVLFVGEDCRSYTLDIRAVVEVDQDAARHGRGRGGAWRAPGASARTGSGACSAISAGCPGRWARRPIPGRASERPGEHFGRAGVSASRSVARLRPIGDDHV